MTFRADARGSLEKSVSDLCRRLARSVGGSWKDASGHRRLVREQWSSVAMTQRQYPGVRLHPSGSAVRLFV